jgi:hypothetical protein
MMLWQIFLTLVVAACGGLLGRKLKIPAGTMLGALLFTILFNVFLDKAYIPGDFRPWLQMLSGILLGSGISRRDVRELKFLIVPGIVMIINMIILNIIFGYLMFRFSNLDLATSLLATAPGGMTDMALIAAELGGEMMPVTILHLARLLIIYALLPWIFARLRQYQASNGKGAACEAALAAAGTSSTESLTGESKKQYLGNSLLTFIAAAAGGILLWQLGINAGAMIGSMLAVAALNLTTGRARSSGRMRIGVQIIAGAFVGQNMNRENLGLMAELLVPVLIMVISVLVFILVVSVSLIWLSKLERATCILISAPGGLQEVSLMAIDLNADAPKVMVMQTTRLMVVIALFPTLLTTAADFLDGA